MMKNAAKPEQAERAVRFLLPAIVGLIVVAMSGTAQAQSDPMTRPVNCSTADGDLRALYAEKAHAQSLQLLNITAVTPAGALLGLITGTETKKLEMLTGEYEQKIDARVAEIKKTCKK